MSLLGTNNEGAPLTAWDRFTACCSGKTSLGRFAFGVASSLCILSWTLFFWGMAWASRHEVPPYRITLPMALPGVVMTGLLVIFMVLSIHHDGLANDEDPFGDNRRRNHAIKVTNTACCIIFTLVPLCVGVYMVHSTWYDPTAAGTVPPSWYNETHHPQQQQQQQARWETDEGLKRGIFSSISGSSKATTPPPPTTTVPPPMTWPPYTDTVPSSAYIWHLVLQLLSLAACALGDLWRQQELSRPSSDL